MQFQYEQMTRAEISIDALHHNLGQFREHLPKGLKIMAVVKANGYGHGAVQIAKEALSFGVEYLAVARIEEAIHLRHAGITAPLLVLGYTPIPSIQLARALQISITVYDEDTLMFLINETRQDDERLKIHIKVDTGMGRIGIIERERVLEYILKLSTVRHIEIEGIFTHYATADQLKKNYMQLQYERFMQIVADLEAHGVKPPLVHAGNSATAIDAPKLSGNLIRLGIAMYGLKPSAEVAYERLNLRQVMTLKTSITRIETLQKDWGISYGLQYRPDGIEQIGTIPIGYADGYSRRLSQVSEVLVHGKRYPLVGNICMDQCMFSNKGAEQRLALGDEVVLFGQQGEEEITIDEIADLLGTINYEIPCMVQLRVPRIYIKNGKVDSVWDGLRQMIPFPNSVI